MSTQAAEKTKKTVGHNSLIMASGTLASRLTGQVRTILLAAAIGVTGVAANAYQVGSQIPHVVFNLLEGGLINAILVPQIVQAFKHKNFSERINKLLTLAISICLGFMILLMLCTPFLVNLYINSDWTEAQKALANGFTLCCMPQILFYGIYTVVGQILAAKEDFTAYAWSSVAANVVACAGYGLFIFMFGKAQTQPLNFWTPEKVALTAGAWTVGIGVQAVILFVPLIKQGIHPKITWGIHGIGLRSMGRVAAWTLASVVIDQIAGIINTRIETGAPVIAGNRLMTAGAQAYAQAFQIWILPYSLVTVSISTAVFPVISKAVEESRINDARHSLTDSLRSSGAIMFFFTACFLTMPVPIIRALLPSVGVYDANLLAGPLMALAFNLVPVSVTLLLNRVFYSYEDGRSPFILTTIQNIAQVAILLIGTKIFAASLWDTWVGASITLSNFILMPISCFVIRRRMNGHIGLRSVLTVFSKSIVSAITVALFGILVSGFIERLLHADTSLSNGHMSWIQAILTCAITGILMLALYWCILHVLHVKEMDAFAAVILRKFGHKSTGAHSLRNTENDNSNAVRTPRSARGIASYRLAENAFDAADDATIIYGVAPFAFAPQQNALFDSRAGSMASTNINTPYVPRRVVSSQKTSRTITQPHLPALISTMSPISSQPRDLKVPEMPGVVRKMSLSRQNNGRTMIPAIGDTIDKRYTLIAQYRSERGLSAWLANDHTLMCDCQLYIITDSKRISQVNAIASSLVLSRNPHCTRVLHLQKEGGVSVIVTETDPGISLQQFIEQHNVKPISIDVMRTICFKIIETMQSLRAQSLSYRSLNSCVVRLTQNDVILADTSISPLLTTPLQKEDDTANDETLAIRQIASILYEMITHQVFDPTQRAHAAQLLMKQQHDLPVEFINICRRALNIPVQTEFESDKPIPILTLLELEILLGEQTKLEDLSRNDYDIPATPGDASICNPKCAVASSKDITEIPDSLVSNELIKPTTDDNNSDKHEKARRQVSQWGASQLLGNNHDAIEEMNPGDSNLFSAFDTTHTTTTRHSGRVASSGRSASSTLHHQPGKTQAARTSTNPTTTTAKATPQQGDQQKDSQRSTPRNARSMQYAATMAAQNQKARVAANRSPQQRDPRMNPYAVRAAQTRRPAAAAAETKKKGIGRTSIIIIIVLLVALLFGWAIKASHILAFHFNNDNSHVAWTLNVNEAPIPGGTAEEKADANITGANVNSSSSNSTSNTQTNTANNSDNTNKVASSTSTTTASTTSADLSLKNAKTVPSPETVASTSNAFAINKLHVVEVPGKTGFGLYIQLANPQLVKQIQITTVAGGGEASVYANSTPDNPQNGDSLADFSFAPNGQTTTVVLSQATQTQNLMIWVSQKPTSGFEYQSVLVY